MSARRVRAFTSVLMAISVLPACSDGDAYDGPVGTARIAIQLVPSDVRCISISVAGPRAVSKAFTVTPHGATTLTLPGLGAGANTFTGAAFPVACPSDLSALVANWVADPVAATVREELSPDAA